MQPHPSYMLLGGAGGPFTAAASPSSLSATGYNGNPVTSGGTTVTPTGPTGFTYTYAWTRVSGSTGITAGSPSSATTAFTGTPGNNSTISATFQCTVTRNDGFTASATVSVSLSAVNPPFGVSVAPSDSSSVNVPAGTAFSKSLTAGGSGGSPPYSFTWSCTGPGASCSPTSGTSSTLTVPGQAAGNTATVTLVAHGTDNLGATASAGNSYNLTWV